ncbi:MAG: TIGR03960 family B12-binding radical SAM protein [Deltaproteobacteria bacterium]|nr:TIGR03960 family B12-binding radical SAM protein [Deltaproteobacteria bacterium]
MNAINIKDLLTMVRKPSRYMGGEVNSVKKDLSTVRLTFGLAFPDAYEVGMSHLGIQILYQALNAMDNIACERVFAPWLDMEALLKRLGLPLATLESAIPLESLDVIGFSLQYELSYTNVLNMLELGNVPLFSLDRGEGHPFVIGGGPCAFNPEPIADFFDAFLLGDGEEAVIEMAEAIIASKAAGEDRHSTLKRLAAIQGVYVPSFFSVSYNADSTVREISPLHEGYEAVVKRTIADMNGLPRPSRPVVPFMETIHDRVSVEINRGCTRGCRFCGAGSIYRPSREREPDEVIRIVDETLMSTGYDEVSLLSLSAGDYTAIEGLMSALMARYSSGSVAVSLPSMRVGTLSASLATEIRKVRKTGFTLAPEAGSDRLRVIINKGINEEDLKRCAKDVFSLGWKGMKLYFMVGLPTETDEDISAIVSLAVCVREIGKAVSSGKAPDINVSAACFVPKPHTPFQWEPQLSPDESARRLFSLKRELTRRKLGFKWGDSGMSLLEGVFSRGDRRLSKLILAAFRKGARFDGWTEQFNLKLWQEAFSECNIDMRFYTERRRGFDEVLPWDHLSSGVTKEFLLREYEQAVNGKGVETKDCKVFNCTNCGVCDHKVIKNVSAKEAIMRSNAPAPQPASIAYRLRFRFSKTGPARLLSHLELINALLRAARRAGLPLAYSQGFHPLAKLSFASSLPVGLESEAEVMDMELRPENGKILPDEALSRLNRQSPIGIEFLECEEVPLKSGFPSAMMTEYVLTLTDASKRLKAVGLHIDFDDINGIVRDFQAKDACVVAIEKADKTISVDIMPMVHSLEALGNGRIRFLLRQSAGSGVRPVAVAQGILGLSAQVASLIPIRKKRGICVAHSL